jgi:hypothetical protein
MTIVWGAQALAPAERAQLMGRVAATFSDLVAPLPLQEARVAIQAAHRQVVEMGLSIKRANSAMTATPLPVMGAVAHAKLNRTTPVRLKAGDAV